jgi:hypothetical protein
MMQVITLNTCNMYTIHGRTPTRLHARLNVGMVSEGNSTSPSQSSSTISTFHLLLSLSSLPFSSPLLFSLSLQIHLHPRDEGRRQLLPRLPPCGPLRRPGPKVRRYGAAGLLLLRQARLGRIACRQCVHLRASAFVHARVPARLLLLLLQPPPAAEAHCLPPARTSRCECACMVAVRACVRAHAFVCVKKLASTAAADEAACQCVRDSE